MNEWALLLIAIAAAYLLGAVPFGLLVAAARGVDIRKTGSRNIGATNVFRSVGRPWGMLTFAADVLKGFIPAFFFPIIMERLSGAEAHPLTGLACGAAAIIGHNWPVYLAFKGGKGIATSAGMLLGVAPEAAGAALIVWLFAMMTTRYVSVASICAALTVALCGWLFYLEDGWLLPGILSLLAALAVWKHRANIQRLMNGTENRFGKKRASTDASQP